MSCDFQQCGILTSVGSEEPVQPPFKLRNSNDVHSVANGNSIFKRLAKALIRLCVCAGWSEHLLVANTTLLEISCCDSNCKHVILPRENTNIVFVLICMYVEFNGKHELIGISVYTINFTE